VAEPGYARDLAAVLVEDVLWLDGVFEHFCISKIGAVPIDCVAIIAQ
jgi:hypothetical protein